jgi:hypothetical protein
MNIKWVLFIVFLGILLLISLFNNSKEKFSGGNEKSREEMKKYNVIFGGTIRNVEKYIKKGLSDIDLCGQKFNDYAVILYENDSDDNTRSILQDLKKDNYYYIFEDNVKEKLRTKRLANGRNKVLDKMRKINANGYYDYFINLDMDDVNSSGMFVDSIETCFEHEKWDVLTGNQSGIYYDLWALRKKDDMEYDCHEKIRKHKYNPFAYYKYLRSRLKNYPQTTKLLEVDSAFGGAGIYKIQSIPEHCRYVGQHTNGNEKCEHVEFNECIKKNGGAIFINTRFLTS